MLFNGLFRFNISMSCEVNSDESFLSRDDEFLFFFVVDRVAVWDMTQRDQPQYIGTAPVLPPLESHRLLIWKSHHITPIEREDGALGIVTMNGIYWLEFPALMKEAKS
jgi:hypothetical protein